MPWGAKTYCLVVQTQGTLFFFSFVFCAAPSGYRKATHLDFA